MDYGAARNLVGYDEFFLWRGHKCSNFIILLLYRLYTDYYMTLQAICQLKHDL